MIKININKTNLNKIIKWSPSKYNKWSKKEVVEQILKYVERGKSITWEFNTGSYTTFGDFMGWTYFLIIREDGKITLTCPQRKERFELLKKDLTDHYLIKEFNAFPINVNDKIGNLKHDTGLYSALEILKTRKIKTFKSRGVVIPEMGKKYSNYIFLNKTGNYSISSGARFIINGDSLKKEVSLYRNAKTEGDLYIAKGDISLKHVTRLEIHRNAIFIHEDMYQPLVLKARELKMEVKVF